MTVEPINEPWTIIQGASNTRSFRPFQTVDGEPSYFDLTAPGWSARSQIRQRVGGTIWADLSSDATEGARIELDADGWVTLVLPPAVTEAAAWDGYARKKGVYDVELIHPDGHVDRLAEGEVEVSPDVTRSA